MLQRNKHTHKLTNEAAAALIDYPPLPTLTLSLKHLFIDYCHLHILLCTCLCISHILNSISVLVTPVLLMSAVKEAYCFLRFDNQISICIVGGTS